VVGAGEVPIVLLDEQSQQFQITMTLSVLVEQRKLVGCFKMVSCFVYFVYFGHHHYKYEP